MHELRRHAHTVVGDFDHRALALSAQYHGDISGTARCVDGILHQVTDDMLESVGVSYRRNIARELHGDRRLLSGLCLTYAANDLLQIHRMSLLDRGRSGTKLKHEVVHSFDHIIHGHQHIALKCRIVAVSLSIAQQQ